VQKGLSREFYGGRRFWLVFCHDIGSSCIRQDIGFRSFKNRLAAERAQPASSRRQRNKAGSDGSTGQGKRRAGGGEAGVQCGDAEVAATLQQRDPQGFGLPDDEGRELLRRMLAWEPSDRISAKEALHHPYLSRDGSGGSTQTWAENWMYCIDATVWSPIIW
jgi:serine/threonine protein kinase